MTCDIIVVVWNQIRVTNRCLESVIRNTQADYRIIIIDNASDDETKIYVDSFVKKHGNKVILLRNETNIGFLKAANQGLRKSTAKYTCLLNNDTIVTKGWLDELMGVAEANSDLGILNPSSTTLGQKVPLKDIDKYAGKIKIYQGEYIEMAQASGFCMFITRELINAIGLLDEIYGIGYFEDTDYCRRAKEAGFKIARVKASYIYHQENASFIKLKRRDEVFKANRKIFEERWGKPLRVFIEAKDGLEKNEIKALFNFANKANWFIIAFSENLPQNIKHSNIRFIKYPSVFFYIPVFFKVISRTKKKYDMIVIRNISLRKVLEKLRFIHKAEVISFQEAFNKME